jgi:hypothetical protein
LFYGGHPLDLFEKILRRKQRSEKTNFAKKKTNPLKIRIYR